VRGSRVHECAGELAALREEEELPEEAFADGAGLGEVESG
jgi:hypothetical protein